MKRIIEFLSCIPMTAVGGVCLILSFVLPKVNVNLPVDPAWATVVISGLPLFYLAVRRLICNPGIRKISSALLITVAMIAAIIIGDLFAAGEVAFIMALGEILEDLTTDRAKKGLKKLICLTPTQGRRMIDGSEEMIPAEKIRCGDILRILPGEAIPVDGVILRGETSVDQSIMTGESLPVDKNEGDEVFCGTINRFGVIDIRATKVSEDSSLQKLIRMVKEAEEKKAPMARIADQWASWLVPVAMVIAILTGLVSQNVTRAVTVLVVFCPCALVLATPTAIMAAIGQATKHGVIIKSGEALEKMGRVDTVAFDKTGTLTYGRLEVSDVLSFDGRTDETVLLSLVASAEAKSEHPLGKAIVTHAKGNGIEITESDRFSMESGKGIFAEVGGRSLLCGNESFLLDHEIIIPSEIVAKSEELRKQGKALVFVAENGSCIGIVALSDVLRPDAAQMVSKLHVMNTESLLLTGDNRMTADYFSTQVGIREVRSELLPEQKVAEIVRLQQNHRSVCMIGDGVNDAPALKTADVGVAMGSMGSDIAVEAADIALMSDDISKIPYLKRLAKATVNTIKFSISLSMFINLLAVLLSVLGVLNPTTGALVHNAGSCFVVLIAALLYDRKFKS
ncbi:MAG: cation-translocating P-type ATPase [Clostridia bacterium]|nr:cation-translocating P-type ATPase [Clostridia bacterium]MBR7098946.1 cation-translocating P-type ATPase [Clostridia bacterium]